MNDRKFVNQFQPQTLYIATVLLYINAVFGFLSFSPIMMLISVVMAASGYGIANELRWGYVVALVVAILWVVLLIAIAGTDVLGFPLILNLLFDGALVGLLAHPQSREYQSIWFK